MEGREWRKQKLLRSKWYLDVKFNSGEIQSLFSPVCYRLWMMPVGVTDGGKRYAITQIPPLDAFSGPDLGQALVLSTAHWKVLFCWQPHSWDHPAPSDLGSGCSCGTFIASCVLVALSPRSLQLSSWARVINKYMIWGKLMNLLW